MGVRDLYNSFFEPKEAIANAEGEALKWAHSVADCHDQPYFKGFIADLEKEIFLPLDTGAGDLHAISKAIGRADALRTVLSMIRRDAARAKRLIAQDEAREE